MKDELKPVIQALAPHAAYPKLFSSFGYDDVLGHKGFYITFRPQKPETNPEPIIERFSSEQEIAQRTGKRPQFLIRPHYKTYAPDRYDLVRFYKYRELVDDYWRYDFTEFAQLTKVTVEDLIVWLKDEVANEQEINKGKFLNYQKRHYWEERLMITFSNFILLGAVLIGLYLYFNGLPQ